MKKIITLPIKDLIDIEHLKTNHKFSDFIYESNEDNITELYTNLKKSLKKVNSETVLHYINNLHLKFYHEVGTDAILMNVYYVSSKISLLILKIFTELDLIQKTHKIPCEFIEQTKFDPNSEWNPDISGGLDFYVTSKLMKLTFGINSRSLMDDFFEFKFNGNAKKFVTKANKSAFGTLDKTQDKQHLNTVDAKYSERYISLKNAIKYPNFHDYINKKVTFYCKICQKSHTEIAQNAIKLFVYDFEKKTARFCCDQENLQAHGIEKNNLHDEELKDAFDYIESLNLKQVETKKLYILLYIYNNKNRYGFHKYFDK